MSASDTIAAISSVPAPSRRIIVRLSGPRSLAIATELSSIKNFAPASARQVMLSFKDLVCPAWVYAFVGPRSYTGEDSVEFHLPGSPVLARLLLDDLFSRGVRSADPGEFTARAFFNGKIGLTEAEGVAATIAAGNASELSAARRLLAGELAKCLSPITESIAQTLALIEVGIDFTEEDVTFLAADEVIAQLDEANENLRDLMDQSSRFGSLSHEPRIVFAGWPNAGKSSLINALTNQQRAVVSDIAGTTRDVLSAPLYLPRGRVLLSDVAGWESPAQGDDPQSQIDRQMQVQARNAIQSADHLVLIRDCTDDQPPPAFDRKTDLEVLTKWDLRDSSFANGAPLPIGNNEVSISASHLPQPRKLPSITVSSTTRSGLDQLRDILDSIAFGEDRTGTTLSLNTRHLAGITAARESIAQGQSRAIENAPELLAMDLRDALDSLGSIVGHITRDDVLGKIFSAFCIGK